MKQATPRTRKYWDATQDFLNHLTNQTTTHVLDIEGHKQAKERVMQLSKSFLTGRYPAELTETFLKDRDKAFLEHVHTEGRAPRYQTYTNGQKEDMQVVAHSVLLDMFLTDDEEARAWRIGGLERFFEAKYPSYKEEYLAHFNNELKEGQLLVLPARQTVEQ